MKLPGTATQPENIYIALGKLGLGPGMVFLDLGCGSGAVCRQAALFTDRIYGVDRRPEAVQASRELVPQGTFVLGEAADVLDSLPRPDRCFVGGTRGIEDFLPVLAGRAAPGFRLVVSLARIGAAARVAGLVKKHFVEEEFLQITINRGYELAGDLALRPVNPIFMVVARR
ncbi:MAG TPA: methyltransferase domain-containing protein [Methanotrichaceae archaeon]|nr:methyltransferase domain-containing protein [Methanotrichaceae archaeon]HQF15566.1 methyltransferase domain-containing protein [Methanotrichaceae archaeon]HQI90302.1 methyltransferase domain-containing protein [Methanotrichaceae archaeon]HQJ27731.1 methyltransferase domain-containing protein [Methanotrichaceae archaeon]